MNRLFNLIKFCLVCLGLFLASCTSNEPAKTEKETTKPAVEQAIPEKQEISIAAMKFSPDAISVKVGDTLVFTNNDLVAHNVTQYPDSKWASPSLEPGDSWTYLPKESDSFFCSFHIIMKGNIKVN